MSTYSDLGFLIEQHRPYGTVGKLPDLTDASRFRLAKVPAKSEQDRIDVFGPLFDYGKSGAKGLLEVMTTADPYTQQPKIAAVEPVSGQYVEDGAFHVTLPSGEEVRITKGIHIPYAYKDNEDNTVYASILVLFNGIGNP